MRIDIKMFEEIF